MSDIKLDKAAQHKQDMDWLFVCIQDVVDSWPKMTLRTMFNFCKSIDALKEAYQKVR